MAGATHWNTAQCRSSACRAQPWSARLLPPFVLFCCSVLLAAPDLLTVRRHKRAANARDTPAGSQADAGPSGKQGGERLLTLPDPMAADDDDHGAGGAEGEEEPEQESLAALVPRLMYRNGYLSAKVVRARLLHYHICGITGEGAGSGALASQERSCDTDVGGRL